MILQLFEFNSLYILCLVKKEVDNEKALDRGKRDT